MGINSTEPERIAALNVAHMNTVCSYKGIPWLGELIKKILVNAGIWSLRVSKILPGVPVQLSLNEAEKICIR